MKLYIQLVDGVITEVDSEKQLDDYIVLNIESVDDFLEQAQKYGTFDEEIENKVLLYLDDSESDLIQNFHIKHWVSNRSFGELTDMYNCGEIKKPEMQRAFVWNSQKSSRLIESILLGLPIPPLFFMEVGNNKYEVIDGYQRLTTIANFILGRPWHDSPELKRRYPAKLSGNLSGNLNGKTFEKLSIDQRRTIMRSTIPLIEFRQIDPEDSSSKYLIFERINTGSEKLNYMQIRKSLAYGTFMESLYDAANKSTLLKQLFSVNSIRQDAHVEALLRIIAMSDIYYGEYNTEKRGINNILNDYCESKRNNPLDDKLVKNINLSLDFLMKVFGQKEYLFKRTEINEEGIAKFTGNMNVSILEAMIGVMVHNIQICNSNNFKTIKDNYIQEMITTIDKSIKKQEINPFSTSTGKRSSINKRFKICEKILGI